MNRQLWLRLHAAEHTEHMRGLIPLLPRSVRFDTVQQCVRRNRTNAARLRRGGTPHWEKKGAKLFIRCVPCRSSAEIRFFIAHSRRLIDTALSPYYSLSVKSNLIHSLKRSPSVDLACVRALTPGLRKPS